MENIVLATGMPKLNSIFKSKRFAADYSVAAVADRREDVLDILQQYKKSVHILLVTDALPGKGLILELLMKAKTQNPNLRVIYLTADIKKQNEARLSSLGMLVFIGIYDIIMNSQLNPRLVYQSLKHPATVESVGWINRHMNKQETSQEADLIEIRDEEEKTTKTDTTQGLPNVHMFSSIKPGTGKSFISANIATTIAKYGAKREDGQPPKVALIDGDLQNLSLGTLLQLEDDEYNLKTVMDKISTIQDKKGNIIGTPAQVKEVNMFINKAFLPYSRVKNLEALVGSQLEIDKVEGITGHQFYYLIATIFNEYDVVILDSNSSLAHVSTFSLLNTAKTINYILNLDFNNIRNNKRYVSTLTKLGVMDRVNYILNESLTQEAIDRDGKGERLLYTSDHLKESGGFNIIGDVPMVSKPVFLNHIYEGRPVALDNEPNTLDVRYELAKIANQIWPIEKLPYMEKQIQDRDAREQEPKAKKKIFGFGG